MHTARNAILGIVGYFDFIGDYYLMARRRRNGCAYWLIAAYWLNNSLKSVLRKHTLAGLRTNPSCSGLGADGLSAGGAIDWETRRPAALAEDVTLRS